MFNAASIPSVAFRLFGVDIYWYGVAYVVSLWLAFSYAKYICQRGALENGRNNALPTAQTTQQQDRQCFFRFLGCVRSGPPGGAAIIDDFFLLACCAVIIGGRLGHIIFFEPSYYLRHLAAIWDFRAGGMSFHGGLIGIVTAAYFFCRIKKVDIWRFMDVLAAVAPIGLGLGRIANFINNELYGKPTQSCFGVVFRGAAGPRHPTQIYEALGEGVATFLLLYALSNTDWCRKSPGALSAIFLISYAFFRIIIDFFKDAQVYGALTMGQWLSLGMLCCGVIVLKYRVSRAKGLPS
jgi:phosphatidylglycerol:prolipoprotein diacylglycerol transferase